MYRIIIVCLFFWGTCHDLAAQCEGFSGIVQVEDNSAVGHSLCRTDDGGFLLAGVSSNFGSGNLDWIVTKLDAAMQPVFSRAMGWSSEESGGNIVIEEFSDQTIVHAGYRLMGNRITTISKLSADGNLLWSKQLVASGCTPRDIEETSDGGILVSGSVQVPSSISDDIFMLKLSADGDFVWGHRFDSSEGNEHIYGIAVDQAGVIYCVGNTEGFAGTHRGFVMKMDQTGAVLDQMVFNSGSFSTFLDVEITGDDELLISGYENVGSDRNGVVIKSDLNFNIIWQRLISFSNITTAVSVEVDVLGRVVAGFTNNGGGGFLSIAHINGENGNVVNSVRTEVGEAVVAQIISNVFQSGPAGDVAAISSTNFSLYGFDSCFASECQGTVNPDVTTGNFVVQDYSIPVFDLPEVDDATPTVLNIDLAVNSECATEFNFEAAVDDGCAGDEFVFQLTDVSDINQVASVVWSVSGFDDFSGNPSTLVIGNPGNYTWSVLVTTVSGSEYSETGILNVFEGTEGESLALPEEVNLCSGETFEIDFAPFLNSWDAILDSDGNQITSFETNTAGSYTFTAQNACGSVTQTVELTFLEINPQQIIYNPNICPEQDTLVIGFTDPAFTYLWMNTSTSSSISVSTPGNYQVQVSIDGCSETFNFGIVELAPLDLSLFPDDEVVVCSEGDRMLILPNLGVPFTFSDGSQGFTYLVESSETLEVSFTDGCYAYNKAVDIELIDCLCPLFVPNAFTPDEDGLNDIFKPVVDCPVEDYHLRIFNRLGTLIFESRDIHFGWNGHSPNENYYAENELYLYHIIYAQRLDGLLNPIELSGHLTLVR
jgi:gliding motility-associated-like protein